MLFGELTRAFDGWSCRQLSEFATEYIGRAQFMHHSELAVFGNTVKNTIHENSRTHDAQPSVATRGGENQLMYILEVGVDVLGNGWGYEQRLVVSLLDKMG